MPTKYIYEDDLLIVWYGLNSLAIALNVVAFLIAINNFRHYIYDRGIRRILVLLFYISVLFITVMSIIIGILYIIEPGRDIMDYSLIFIIKIVSTAFLYWTVGLTMFQLAITLQTILNEVEVDEVDRKELFMFVCVILFMIAYITLAVIYFKYVRFITVGVEAIIMIGNCAILCFLRSKLKCLGHHGFNLAVASVDTQFVLFVIAYLVLVVDDICLYFAPNLLTKFYFYMPVMFID